MSDLFEESSDDEIGIKLHLAERLRINRGEHSFSDRNPESNQDFKYLHNVRRKKLSKDNQSSSSSSLETQNDAGVPGASSPYMLPNKKRQNGDKILEQFTNPKRTCLSDRFRKSSEWRESKKKNYNNGAHCGCSKVNDSTFSYSENSAAKDLYPDNTYEDHLNNLADAEDSDLDFSPQTSRNFQKGIAQNSKLLKSNYQQSSSTKHGADSECRENSTAANRVLYVDSGSDDDSKISVQNGALKGGRQSPDLIFFNKKVLGKKVKKVLDSDDTDEDDWQIGYRNRPLVFTTSSDSEDSRNPNKSALGGASNETANHSFPYRDAYNHKDLHTSVNFRSASNSHFKQPQASRSPCPSTSTMKPQNSPGDDCNPQFLLPAATHDFQSSVSVSKPYRARKSNRVSVPLTNVTTKLPDSFTRRSSPGVPRRGRSRMSGNERRVLRSGSPHPRTMHGQSRAENSKLLRDRSRSVNAAYPQNERSLADVYPDLFDAEDSSEVEFFTANSYSDTETSTESLGGLTINATIVGTSDSLSNAEIVCERNVGSSEDEISVVFATASHSRNDQRRGTSRAIGRRYGRGRDGRHLQRREAVSLSPDPVEQVRQVEEDERFARMLQAQFDAEVDSDYSPRLRQGPHSNTSVESDDDIIDPVDVNDSDSDGMFSSLFPFVHVSTARRGRVRRISSRPGTPNSFPQALFFAFLGLAELNGEVIPRGLQRAQINRLPTRKYTSPNAASSSCQSSEITHKRTELNKECQVCLSDYENGDVLRILPCFHEFHTPCIDPWLKINHTCPVCRVIVDLEE